MQSNKKPTKEDGNSKNRPFVDYNMGKTSLIERAYHMVEQLEKE